MVQPYPTDAATAAFHEHTPRVLSATDNENRGSAAERAEFVAYRAQLAADRRNGRSEYDQHNVRDV